MQVCVFAHWHKVIILCTSHKAQAGRILRGGTQRRGRAAGKLYARYVLQESSLQDSHPGHSFTLLLSFLVLVLWSCSCLSCFGTAWIGAFVCILFSLFAVGKTGKGWQLPALVLATVPFKIERIGTREGRKVDGYQEMLRGRKRAEWGGRISKTVRDFLAWNWLFQSGQMSSATQLAAASFDQKATSPWWSRTMTGISMHISFDFFIPFQELR